MLKFLAGIALGVVLAFGYVRWNISLPAWLELPDKLKGNVISTAVEADLYDLDGAPQTRLRALEVFFQNRPQFAAAVDKEYSHPFLNALYRKRATHEARLLRTAWSDFDKALSQPALRKTLERKHGVTDTRQLKQAMLFEQLQRKEFLKLWLGKTIGAVPQTELLGRLTEISRLPE